MSIIFVGDVGPQYMHTCFEIEYETETERQRKSVKSNKY